MTNNNFTTKALSSHHFFGIGIVVDDVFLVLSGDDKEIKIPQEAENFEALFDVFKKFEGFNYEAFIEAMSSTENAKFVCWKRADKPEGSREAPRSEVEG